jgi:23S rRNA (cytosine1962-C5)-methyltransferase
MEVDEVQQQGEVVITKRGAARIRNGHLWVYRSDVVECAAEPGAIAAVRDPRGAIAGKAFYSSTSQIALRFLARGDAVIDQGFFERRLAQADALRSRAGVDPQLSRRVNSEGDLLPGLIVDRYGDYLVVQSLTQAVNRLQSQFTQLLQHRYRPRSIILRNDNKVRELEGLPLVQEWIGEEPPKSVVVDEDGRAIEVLLQSGQKTGAFLDQRRNHRRARRYAQGRGLDAFCHSGGFALNLAEGCAEVEAVDSSEEAIRLARANVQRNGFTNVECIQANAFDYLREKFERAARYDVIVLDPPPFARNREALAGAVRGYKEINQRAMRLLQPGGILITCSCSHHVSEAIFAETLAEAARDAGVWARVLERPMPPADHPVLLAVPETLYLKCFILEVLT